MWVELQRFAEALLRLVEPTLIKSQRAQRLYQAWRVGMNRRGAQQVALPPMGTGLYGVPLDVCSRVMVDAVKEHLAAAPKVKEIVFVALDAREYGPFAARLETLKAAEVRS